jgi:hypothetical protein
MAAAAGRPIDMILAWVESQTPESLASMKRDDMMRLMAFMPDQQDFQKFMFAKNKRIFGGINGYVEDFLGKGTVDRILAMPAGPGRTSALTGAKRTLDEMKIDAGISEANKALVVAALARLEGAQGGGRRRRSTRHRSTRRRKSQSRRR